MAYKNISPEIKVLALSEALTLKNTKEIAEKYGLSEDTIKNDFKKIMKNTTCEIALHCNFTFMGFMQLHNL